MSLHDKIAARQKPGKSSESLIQKISAEKFLVVFLLILSIHSVLSSGVNSFIHIIVSVLSASVIDLIFMAKNNKIEFPYLAVISGFIIGLILQPRFLYEPVIVASVAMLLKHMIKYKERNIFNPAGLSLLLFSFFLGISWWGTYSLLIIPLGLFISWKIKNLTESFSFLIVYSILFFAYTSSILIINASILFFALVMVIEPVTTAHTKKGKIIFGSFVGLLAFVSSFLAIDYLLLALLIMNIFVYKLDQFK